MIALRLKRRIANLATIISLLIAVSAMGAWIIPAPAWGRWRALQRPHTSYFADVSGGYLTLRIARVYPEPGLPATARWQWFGSHHSFASVGSITDQSFFSRIGLITTFERIPYSIIDEDPYVTSGIMPFRADPAARAGADPAATKPAMSG
jgi:hypothetical protein